MKIQTVVRLGISAVALGLAALPAFLTPACLSSNGNNADAGGGGGGSSSGSGGTTSSSGVSTSGSGGAVGDGGPGGGAVTCLLDDMSGPSNTTGGYWFTYSDRTCANTALLMDGAAGTLNPVEGYPSNPAVDSTGATMTVTLPGASMPLGYREFTGGGEKTWGAGFGFNLTNDGMDPFKQCTTPSTCTGTAPMVDAAVGFPAPFDASMHKGISFFAKSVMATATMPTKVRVQLSDHHTDPGSGISGAGPDAGVCDPCDNSSSGPNRCANDFYQSVSLTSDWQQFTVMFASIPTDTWTKKYAAGQFDPSTLYHVHWQLNAPTPTFDIQIACISWVDM